MKFFWSLIKKPQKFNFRKAQRPFIAPFCALLYFEFFNFTSRLLLVLCLLLVHKNKFPTVIEIAILTEKSIYQKNDDVSILIEIYSRQTIMFQLEASDSLFGKSLDAELEIQ